MKTYWDLTSRERLALEPDEIKDVYIPREVASQGLLVPRKPTLVEVPEKPDAEEPPTIPYYEVTGFPNAADNYSKYTFDSLFQTLEAAQQFMALKPCSKQSEYRGNSYNYTVTPMVRYEVQLVNVSDKATLGHFKEVMKAYDDAFRSNESATSTYNNECSKIIRAGTKITDNHNKLQARRAELEQVIETLGEFVKVAEGRVDLAIRFLLKNTPAQRVFDALNEIDHGYEWDTLTSFEGVCLTQDNNPYRDVDANLF